MSRRSTAVRKAQEETRKKIEEQEKLRDKIVEEAMKKAGVKETIEKLGKERKKVKKETVKELQRKAVGIEKELKGVYDELESRIDDAIKDWDKVKGVQIVEESIDVWEWADVMKDKRVNFLVNKRLELSEKLREIEEKLYGHKYIR